jgi:hypothetical protein
MFDGYVMASQRQAHNQALGRAAAPDQADGPKIELF